MRKYVSVLVLLVGLALTCPAAAQPVPSYWNAAQNTHNFTVGSLLTPWNSYYVSTSDQTTTYEWFDASQLYADAAMVRYGDTRYIPYMNNTYWFMGMFWDTGSPAGGYRAAAAPNGTNVATDRIYVDDNALTGVAYLDAYDAITDPTMRANYLASAQAIANWLMYGGVWDATPGAGGGFWWNTVDRWKPTQSNGLAIQLFLRLYQKTGQSYYLSWAQSTKAFLDSKLFDSSDGLYAWHTGFSKTRKFTYDQAIMIEANLLFFQITGTTSYRTAAQNLATKMHTKLWSSSYGGYRIRSDSVDGG